MRTRWIAVVLLCAAPLLFAGCERAVPKFLIDLAADSLDFKLVRRDCEFSGLVRITGVVKNVGKGNFDSGRGQQSAALYQDGPTGTASKTPVARVQFEDLAAGETVEVTYDRTWNASSPNEGEFPPTYRLQILWDPDILIDGNDNNDDTNPSNDKITRSGSDINDMIVE